MALPIALILFAVIIACAFFGTPYVLAYINGTDTLTSATLGFLYSATLTLFSAWVGVTAFPSFFLGA